MNDDDLTGLTAASDQLGALGRALADELATFYLRLVERGVPAALARQLTVTHQAYRCGWTTTDD